MQTPFELPPGALPRTEEESERLKEAVARRAGPPRTRHLRDDGSARFANRLALETSPYLLQHAHNPVDWRPWGSEAFEAARKLGRPVFLSIGYSTCHWCHVMEEESFEDPEIAQLLNEEFVCIKVDREERPDVDTVYMQAVQLLTQRGGWPMSVFLTPDKRPFYAGTYFPPRDGDRGSRIGFRTVLHELSRVYREERGRAEENAGQIALAVRESLQPDEPTGLPELHVLHGAMEHYAQVFDAQEGGVRRAPKFPSSMNVRFLLRYFRRTGNEAALRMALLTLEKMALGGLYDQVGGGFHRYSTDARWLVPHFEKMLYDNALLAMAYVEAWQACGAGDARRGAFFRRIAEEVLDYAAREMGDERGGFWSATDADSEGEEGTFFVWTPEQLRDVLGRDDGDRAAALYGVTHEGNFEESGASVLSLRAVPEGDDAAFLSRIRPLLYAARAKRPPPLTDRKVLASWNGLLISAFARAGLAFARPDYLVRAARAASYLLETHLAGGALVRSSLGGAVNESNKGVLEDYAFLAAGLVDLFEATGEPKWLRAALDLHETLRAKFAAQGGGFFRTGEGYEELLAREKPAYDGAEPTGNSVAALTLLRLSALTSEARFRAEAEALLRSFGALLAGAPAALGEMLLAVDFLLDEPREVVLLRPAGGDDAALLDVLRTRFLPSRVLVRAEAGPAQETLAAATPLAKDRTLVRGGPTAYVCVQAACQLPASDPGELAKQLGA
jgi:uncharacterized protein YyaL (SSP411 family)